MFNTGVLVGASAVVYCKTDDPEVLAEINVHVDADAGVSVEKTVYLAPTPARADREPCITLSPTSVCLFGSFENNPTTTHREVQSLLLRCVKIVHAYRPTFEPAL